MNKQFILKEIQRTARENAGAPLGHRKFESETGIRPYDWQAFWARWGDAVTDAGLDPNVKSEAYSDEYLLGQLIPLIREFGRFPSSGELRLKSREGYLPTEKTYRRFGSKPQLIQRVAEYCKVRDDCQDIVDKCNEQLRAKPRVHDEGSDDPTEKEAEQGYVYLLKSGKFYKIGRSNSTGRREYELAIQLPEKATINHKITTDDPAGIEAYWHNRFADKRKNGEWFDLSAVEVKVFKRRKFM